MRSMVVLLVIYVLLRVFLATGLVNSSVAEPIWNRLITLPDECEELARMQTERVRRTH